MTTFAWVTAAFGALVVGLATSSILDELRNRVAQIQPDRWSQDAVLRAAVTAIVSGAVMVLWVWLWIAYVAG